ncbi:uncharacterized protein LOC110024713 [Phalaenopsis equestris]|uniref:uncharacterized protein LOC110024713 n=1 Tax=Phalaenopsis equestris TaxID=78828 RepID=UPI0009E483F7|nr:uncharacterized protein LOC110024713 [Phalaenopsis equestris]
MTQFNDNIQAASYFDLVFLGSQFTWRRGHTWERLDRFLANDQWFQSYLHSSVTHLTFVRSDHRPLLLYIKAFESNCLKPFRYFNMWFCHPDFLQTISASWKDILHPDPLIKLWLLHKKVSKALRHWNWDSFGDVFKIVEEAKLNLTQLENSNLVDEATLFEANQKVLSIACLEKFLKQKTTISIFIDGDRNTRYYQACIKYRRKCNIIHNIVNSQGSRLHDDSQIAKDTVEYFQGIPTSVPSLRAQLDASEFQEDLGYVHSLNLTNLPNEEEIWTALNSIDPTKTAEPDGFSSDFYRKS